MLRKNILSAIEHPFEVGGMIFTLIGHHSILSFQHKCVLDVEGCFGSHIHHLHDLFGRLLLTSGRGDGEGDFVLSGLIVSRCSTDGVRVSNDTSWHCPSILITSDRLHGIEANTLTSCHFLERCHEICIARCSFSDSDFVFHQFVFVVITFDEKRHNIISRLSEHSS